MRFDLFQRLNTGGVALTDQEIRDCVWRGKFSKFLDARGKNPDFRRVLKLTKKQTENGTREECVLRFFAYLANYEQFVHSVSGFLNDFTKEAAKSFDYKGGATIFKRTFSELASIFPNGLIRPSENRTLGTTSLVLFEAVAVGAALALQKSEKLVAVDLHGWLQSPQLKRYTTGATNDLAAVRGRIEFCRNRFLGVPDVS